MRKLRVATIAAAVTAAVVGSMLQTVPTSSMAAATTGSAGGDIRFAVVGDSLSAGRSRFLGNGLDDETWATYARGDGLEFAGGWARSGATPARMAEHVTRVPDVDVLVILAGTNAVRLGISEREEEASYRRIVKVIRPEQVVIAAIPPYVWRPEAASAYNDDLRALALSEGWNWGDPWGFARQGTGWVPGVSADGTHPADAEQYRRLGLGMRGLILRVAALRPWARGGQQSTGTAQASRDPARATVPSTHG